MQEPLEYGRILTEEDFARIHELRHRKMVDAVMRKHGLKSAAKRERLLASAQEEADEAMAEQVCGLQSVPASPSHAASACVHMHQQRHLLKQGPSCICGTWEHRRVLEG